jgi:hypothetical protein
MLNNHIGFKTFILEDECTQYSQVVLYPIDYKSVYVDMEEMLSSKIAGLRSCRLRVYDFAVNQYVGLEEVAMGEYRLPMTFLLACSSVVLFKYKKMDSETGSSVKETLSESEGRQGVSDTSSLKKERAK